MDKNTTGCRTYQVGSYVLINTIHVIVIVVAAINSYKSIPSPETPAGESGTTAPTPHSYQIPVVSV